MCMTNTIHLSKFIVVDSWRPRTIKWPKEKNLFALLVPKSAASITVWNTLMMSKMLFVASLIDAKTMVHSRSRCMYGTCPIRFYLLPKVSILQLIKLHPSNIIHLQGLGFQEWCWGIFFLTPYKLINQCYLKEKKKSCILCKENVKID